MAEAITWRNVSGQSLADAARPFEYASRSFNDAISGLRGVVTDQQEANQRVVDNRRFEERLGYQEALRGATTPEELLARRAQLEAQFAGMDPKNRAQLMSAMNDRELALRESAIASNQYADQTEERSSRDAIAQIRAGILRGEDMSGQIGALGNRFQADLLKEADERSQTEIDRDRKTKEFGWKGEAHENSLLNSAAQRALYGAQASASNHQIRLAQAEAKALEAERLRGERAAAFAESDNAWGGGSLSGRRNLAKVSEWVNSNVKDADEAASINRAVAKLSGKNLTDAQGNDTGLNIPISLIQQAVQESAGSYSRWNTINPFSWFGDNRYTNWGTDRGDRVTEIINSYLQDPELLREGQEAQALRNAIMLNPASSSPK